MPDMTEQNFTEHVCASLAYGDDARRQELMQAFVRHMHAFVRETGLTHREWLDALDYLKEVAQWSDERRDEFILLSDVLGVSSLVDMVSDRGSPDATQTTVLGPFHIPDQPFFAAGETIVRHPTPGEPLWCHIRVSDTEGNPIEGACVDVWQADAEGLYDLQQGEQDNLRGRFRTDSAGRTHFVSIRPVCYPLPPDGPVRRVFGVMKEHMMRPAHVHVIVEAGGHRRLITHVFPQGEQYLDNDAVHAVRESLIIPFRKIEQCAGDEPEQLKHPYWRADIDIVLDVVA